MIIEAQLLIAGLFLLAFAIVLRKIKNNQHYLKSKITFPIVHTVYCSFVGGFIALLISMFILGAENHRPNIIFGAVAGAIIGFFWALLINNDFNLKLKRFKKDFAWVDSTWSAFVLASVIMYTTIQAFKIPTGSMRYTLLEGDHLFVLKFFYGIRIPFTNIKIFRLAKPQKFDMVVFSAPEKALEPYERGKGVHKDFIKRVIALPGETVEIRNKVVYVNGEPLEEKYKYIDMDFVYPKIRLFDTQIEYQRAWEEGVFDGRVRDNFGPVVVPENCYFVLGDNRDHSKDSRFWGPLKDEYIKGKPLLIYWPPKRIRFLLF